MKKLRQIMTVLAGLWPGNRILLGVFLALVIAVIFVGLNDLLGYILGYLATAVIYLMATRGWRRARNFLVLLGASFFGMIFLSFWYVEVIGRLAVAVGGEGAIETLPVHVLEMFFTYVILFGGATGIVFGLVGAAILGIKGQALPKSTGSVAGKT